MTNTVKKESKRRQAKSGNPVVLSSEDEVLELAGTVDSSAPFTTTGKAGETQTTAVDSGHECETPDETKGNVKQFVAFSGEIAEPKPRPRKRRTLTAGLLAKYLTPKVVGGVAGVVLVVLGLGSLALVIYGRMGKGQKPPGAATQQAKDGILARSGEVPPGTFRRQPVTRSMIRREDAPDAPLFLSLALPSKIKLLPVEEGTPELREAEDIMNRYQQCANWKDKFPLILLHDRSLEVLKDYYENRRSKDPEFDNHIVGAGAMVAGDVRILVLCYPSKERVDGVALAFFHRALDGRLRLNWDAFVGLSDLKWEEFQQARTSEPVLLRGYVTLDDYYNYEFADASAYVSLKLRSPDGSMMLNAFCKRQSTAAAFLLRTLRSIPDNRILAPQPPADQRPVQNLPVAVTVRYPVNAKSNHCVELLEMVPGRWFLFEDESALTSERYREAYELINNLRKFMIGKDVKELK